MLLVLLRLLPRVLPRVLPPVTTRRGGRFGPELAKSVTWNAEKAEVGIPLAPLTGMCQ